MLELITAVVPAGVAGMMDREQNARNVVGYLKRVGIKSVLVEYGPEQYLNKHGDQYLFIRGSDEYPLAGSRNAGAAWVTTPYIAFWDSDVIVPTDQIAKAIEVFEQDNDVDIIVPYSEFIYLADTREARAWAGSFPAESAGTPQALQSSGTGPIHNGGCQLARADAFNRLRGYNTEFVGWAPEDTEFVRRASKLGYGIRRISGEAYHLHHKRAGGVAAHDQLSSPAMDKAAARWADAGAQELLHKLGSVPKGLELDD